MVHGRRNFGPTPKHKPDEVKEEARKSAEEAANERISATRGGLPHERGDEDLKRGFEAEHDGHYQRRAQRQQRS
ncbi:hypothetical protein [Dongia deserti]|uniref:hypothetical protein n=1 Tax=Dongia deserti TaxID=2268030 RepID=UPI000E65A079|nr:hypothetical protein [Dongia deserti]